MNESIFAPLAFPEGKDAFVAVLTTYTSLSTVRRVPRWSLEANINPTWFWWEDLLGEVCRAQRRRFERAMEAA